MYWSRSDSILDLFLYLLLSLSWGLGGWLLVRHAFHLRPIERLPGGLATGFVLFLSLSELMALALPIPLAFWMGGLLVLMAGIAAALFSKIRPWLDLVDLRAWPILLVLVGVTILYMFMLRGQSIFDEYLHIPLISTMAAGDIPPHFYLNPDYYYAYHFGIQLFAASLVRLGGFFPWSAWDISRAVAIAFTLILGWIWLRRLIGSGLGAGIGTFLLVFGGGTRWLLLAIPESWLEWVSQNVQLVGSGWDTAPTLLEALHRNWAFEGGGPLPVPFAFHNGIFVPVNFILGSTGALPYMIILLLLLLLPTRQFTRLEWISWSVIFAILALAAEHWFAFLWVGIALSLFVAIVKSRPTIQVLQKPEIKQWLLILGLSAGISLIQGGFITEVVRGIISRIFGLPVQSYHTFGFSLRWPPALPSAHLGSLSIANLGQLAALGAELGPALLMLLLLMLWLPDQLKKHNWVGSGLAISAFLTLLFPIFFQYGVDRSITRFPATALWTGLLLAYPILWRGSYGWGWLKRTGASLVYASLVASGVVILVTQLYSLPEEEYTYFVQELDVEASSEYWNMLPEAAQIIDRPPERAVALFGRAIRTNAGVYLTLPEWEAMIAAPDPQRMADAGYGFIYLDRTWWNSFTPEQQQRFLQPCVDILNEWRTMDNLDYRVLMDLRNCAGQAD